MAKKKQAKKKHDCGCTYGTVWVGGSNIQQNIIDAAFQYGRDGGTVYVLNGKPCGGPGLPDCH